MAELLNRVEKNVGVVDAEIFGKGGTWGREARVLNTASQVVLDDVTGKMEVKKYSDFGIEELRDQERKEMNAIM